MFSKTDLKKALENQGRKYTKELKDVIDIKDDGSYRFDMSYFTYHYADKMPSEKLCALLGGPIRKPDAELTQRHKDIAAAIQLIYEEVLFKMLNYIYAETKSKNIVLAGGCGLNSVANGKILRNTPFKNIWIQPNSSDGGTSLGVAVYIYNAILGNKKGYGLKDVYLGPEFTTEEVKAFLDKNIIKYSQFKNDAELSNSTAKLIFEN